MFKKGSRSLSLTFECVRPVSRTAQFISISSGVLPYSALGFNSPTPLEGGEARLKSYFYCVIMFHKEPRSADAAWHSLIPRLHPSPDWKFLFWPTSGLPLSAAPSGSWYCPAYCFHGWAAPFVVFRVLVQTHPLCEDAAPDGPWRECRGCAEEKESLQTLCELSPCSISASRFSEKLHKCSFSAQTLTNENIFILFILIHSLTFAFFLTWHHL